MYGGPFLVSSLNPAHSGSSNVVFCRYFFFFLKKLAKIVLGKTASNGKGPCELLNLCLALAL